MSPPSSCPGCTATCPAAGCWSWTGSRARTWAAPYAKPTTPPQRRRRRVLVDSYLKQILVDGFLHADPHPGNFLLQDGPKLGFVDFGACARISEATRHGLRDLYRAGLEQDVALAAQALEALGFRTRSGDVNSLVAWVSLFDSDAVDESREAAWSRLMAAARTTPW